MGAKRTLVNNQLRSLGRGRFSRRRAPASPFSRVGEETKSGRLLTYYHPTKGWRSRVAMGEAAYSSAADQGRAGLSRVWGLITVAMRQAATSLRRGR